MISKKRPNKFLLIFLYLAREAEEIADKKYMKKSTSQKSLQGIKEQLKNLLKTSTERFLLIKKSKSSQKASTKQEGTFRIRQRSSPRTEENGKPSKTTHVQQGQKVLSQVSQTSLYRKRGQKREASKHGTKLIYEVVSQGFIPPRIGWE